MSEPSGLHPHGLAPAERSGRGMQTDPRGDGLERRTAIVTGAGSQASGIGNGRATAVLLARAGAHVVLVDSVSERMVETAELIADNHGESLSLTADVTDEAECRGVVERALDRFGRVDVLVNNVGIVGPSESVVDIDLDEWRRTVDVNITSMLLMSRFAIPRMREVGGGSIVNLSSLAGTLTHPRPAYAATKGAVLSLTRSMAMTHGPEGIRVNAVAPGTVYTPMVQVEALTEQARAARVAIVPLRREGTGWDVGEAVVYLAGNRSRWVTGTTLVVDGGFSADLRMSNAATVTPEPMPSRLGPR
jgi:NAD(P)-dependent dehydrogenase (short-subunit alcohol dehydrogenase family)